jgi:hypothetical protein
MLCGFFVLMPISLLANPSLLFTDEEVSYIRENYLNQKTDVQEDSSEKLSLTAIVYFDENHWALWVNNKVIEPESRDQLELVYVEKVSPDEVIFSWKALPSKTFSLSPPQTISLQK